MKRLDSSEISKTIELPPSESIHQALGANHDLCSGIDELVDNSIDANAQNVCIVFRVAGFRLEQIDIHDDGLGMDAAKMERVLRLGGHEAHSDNNIGIYGMGLKEGSFANADAFTVASRVKGHFATGIRLQKDSFVAGVLNERALTPIWNLRSGLVSPKHGTTVVWNALSGIYEGNDEAEANAYLSTTIEKLRKHLGIRYHRFLEQERVSLRIFVVYDGDGPHETPSVSPINPCGYRKSGHKNYPRRLSIGGSPNAHGLTVHIWTNRSKLDEFQLESKDDLGHQGFYVYIADRLITQGGWFGFQEPRKDYKLLRVVIDEPEVIRQYITISPQKGSVRLAEDFHRFMESLRVVGGDDASFEQVCSDAVEVLRNSNRRSGNPDPLAEGGQGLAPSIKRAIEDEAVIKTSDPVSVVWTSIPSGEFVEVDANQSVIWLNKDYRKLLNPGRGTFNDAPLVKTLVYLLFGDIATSKKTAKAKANASLWSKLLTVAAEEQIKQQES
ncbi:ATP-binding protein [Corynebacterium sp.]|uniref:ATP-binding protein n=1 Tax=Corynebacterium sp. TaxID=1720 RepID=UPI0026DADB3A|nr:ATP-binding protein [Corynebacterium sp.]MDO5032431.1 ATP-binding protein [Corynebacterium sp.]